MTIWFTADTHFSHKNIIEYEKRPFENVRSMNDALVRGWNTHVKPYDVVYHLGDFAFDGKDGMREIMWRLHGRKILIRGNHDRSAKAMHSIGFDVVLEQAVIKLGRHNVYLNHYPISSSEGWIIHGHVHSKWKIAPECKCICVSVENWNYAPVSAEQLTSIMDKQ